MRNERVYRQMIGQFSQNLFLLVETINSIIPTGDVDEAAAVKLQFLANAHLYHIYFSECLDWADP